MDKNTQFQTKSAGIYIGLSAVKWGAWKFLAATTAVLFGGSGYQYATDHAPGYEFAFTLIAMALGWLAIDYGLGGLIAYYYDNKGDSDDSEDQETSTAKYRLLKFLLYFIILRYLCTVTISIWSSGEVADNITTAMDPMEYVAAIERQDSSQAARLQYSKEYQDQLVKTEASRVWEAKRKGHEAIQNAINAGDKWQKINYKNSRFSWLENRKNRDKKDHAYAASIRQAIADSTAWVNAEYDRTKSADQAYTATLSDHSTMAIKDSISVWAANAAATYTAKKERRTTLLIFADIFFGMIGWFCEYLQSLMRKAGVTVKRERTFAYVIRNILASWSEWILAGLERALMIDLDGDGGIGTVKGKSPTPARGSSSWFGSLFGGSDPGSKTTGATASATPSATATPPTVAPPATATTATGATPATDPDKRTVVAGFRRATDDTATTTTKPPTPVPTGVSAGSDKPATAVAPPLQREIEVRLVHGVGYVIHNGTKRDESWVRKQLRAYQTRKKNYEAKGSDTTVVDANIELFKRYIQQIEELTKEA